MIVTRDWIMDNRSVRGGWTKDQLSAIGISWPPPKGWLGFAVGGIITKSAQHRFEASRKASISGGLFDRPQIGDDR